jgi:hypothetical protein
VPIIHHHGVGNRAEHRIPVAGVRVRCIAQIPDLDQELVASLVLLVSVVVVVFVVVVACVTLVHWRLLAIVDERCGNVSHQTMLMAAPCEERSEETSKETWRGAVYSVSHRC